MVITAKTLKMTSRMVQIKRFKNTSCKYNVIVLLV